MGVITERVTANSDIIKTLVKARNIVHALGSSKPVKGIKYSFNELYNAIITLRTKGGKSFSNAEKIANALKWRGRGQVKLINQIGSTLPSAITDNIKLIHNRQTQKAFTMSHAIALLPIMNQYGEQACFYVYNKLINNLNNINSVEFKKTFRWEWLTEYQRQETYQSQTT